MSYVRVGSYYNICEPKIFKISCSCSTHSYHFQYIFLLFFIEYKDNFKPRKPVVKRYNVISWTVYITFAMKHNFNLFHKTTTQTIKYHFSHIYITYRSQNPHMPAKKSLHKIPTISETKTDTKNIGFPPHIRQMVVSHRLYLLRYIIDKWINADRQDRVLRPNDCAVEDNARVLIRYSRAIIRDGYPNLK